MSLTRLRELTESQAGEVLGLRQPNVSRLMRGSSDYEAALTRVIVLGPLIAKTHGTPAIPTRGRFRTTRTAKPSSGAVWLGVAGDVPAASYDECESDPVGESGQ